MTAPRWWWPRGITARLPALVGGLGLSLARRIVEAHGGGVEITSEPRVGTTVRIALPRTSVLSVVRAAPDGQAAARRSTV